MHSGKLCYNEVMKKRILSILAGILILVGAMAPVGVMAVDNTSAKVKDSGSSTDTKSEDKKKNNSEDSSGACSDTNFFGLDPWYAKLKCENGEISQSNFEKDNIKQTVLNIAAVVGKDLLFIAGFVAVGFVVYGGFLMVTSAGNPSSVEKAKKTISGAIIGLVVSMLAYAIVTFVVDRMNGA